MRARIYATLFALALLASGSSFAANSQQQKMTTCNAQAKTQNLTGDARKSFMKTCLSASGATAAPASTPQMRMKQCNADANTKSLKGNDRKSFMKTCLKAA
jgi:hypothetical protein